LSKLIPKDPVLSVLQMRGINTSESYESGDYEKVYTELGKDKANFYFSFIPSHYPKNINAFAFGKNKRRIKSLLKAGYPPEHIKTIIAHHNKNQIPLSDLDKALSKSSEDYFTKLGISGLERKSFFLPKFVWNGIDNQYHNWIKSLFTSGGGISITDGKRALDKVGEALQWTLSITLVDLILSILLSLFLAVRLVRHANKKWVKFTNQFLYFIYSIPIFCLATLMVIYFTTDDYGPITNIFPSIGMDVHPGSSTFSQILLNFPKLILPILIMTLHSLGYTTRFLQRSLHNELNKDYVTTAYAKGLSKNEIIDKHVLKNALIPFITVFISAAVAAFGGLLIVEIIFNVPGIGRLLYNSIKVADWNVVFCILMVISFVTVTIYLVGDILYAYFNPKINFES